MTKRKETKSSSLQEEEDAETLKEKEPHKIGHRKRMKERVLSHGAATLADYELLEMLLYASIPRRDTKELAKRLITEFGSFTALLQASFEALEGVGLSEKIIAILQLPRFSSELLRQEKELKIAHLPDWKALKKYLLQQREMHEKGAKTYLLYLDTRNYLIFIEKLPSQNMLMDEHKEIAKKALELHASAIIIIHSFLEISTMTLLQKANALKRSLQPLSIKIHDIVIIQTLSMDSLRQGGFYNVDK